MSPYRFWKLRRRALRWLLPIVAAIIVGACGSGPPVGGPTETPSQPTATAAVAPTVTRAQPTLVPTSANTGSRATLTAEKDRVRFKLLDQAEQDLAIQAQQQLGKGDAINVDENGRASLNFLDAIRVDIFKNTDLSLTGTIDPDASALDLYALEGGTTLNQMELDQIAADRVRLETTWAVIDDLGTEFIAYYDPAREATWIIVREGVTEVRARGANGQPDQAMVQVNAGEQTWVLRQDQPVQPVPATRAAVGQEFPTLDELTGGAISDAEWLPSLSALTLDGNRTTLLSGQSAQGTITISGPAFGGGLEVTLLSSDPAVLSVPNTVTVPTDATSQAFSMTAGAVSQPTDVVITATYQNDTREITLTILPLPIPTATATPVPPTSTPVPPTVTPTPAPPALADLTLNPARVESGNPSTGIVTLSGPAPEDGVEISLISFDETLATLPPTVVVPAGATSERFDIKTAAVTQDSEVTILASDINGPPIRQTLTLVAPPTLSSFTIEPPRVTAGDAAQGQVVLTRPASVGGIQVNLATNSRLLKVPPSITIAEGEERAVFDIATPQVRQEFEAAIQASVGNAALTSLLTIVPSVQPDL
ncbi:MAG TPA: hypothetical protein VGD58_05585, partial [Herpetosiphonaceae bacterium]